MFFCSDYRKVTYQIVIKANAFHMNTCSISVFLDQYISGLPWGVSFMAEKIWMYVFMYVCILNFNINMSHHTCFSSVDRLATSILIGGETITCYLWDTAGEERV